MTLVIIVFICKNRIEKVLFDIVSRHRGLIKPACVSLLLYLCGIGVRVKCAQEQIAVFVKSWKLQAEFPTVVSHLGYRLHISAKNKFPIYINLFAKFIVTACLLDKKWCNTFPETDCFHRSSAIAHKHSRNILTYRRVCGSPHTCTRIHCLQHIKPFPVSGIIVVCNLTHFLQRESKNTIPPPAYLVSLDIIRRGNLVHASLNAQSLLGLIPHHGLFMHFPDIIASPPLYKHQEVESHVVYAVVALEVISWIGHEAAKF